VVQVEPQVILLSLLVTVPLPAPPLFTVSVDENAVTVTWLKLAATGKVGSPYMRSPTLPAVNVESVTANTWTPFK